MAGKDHLNLIFIKAAIKLPLHTPVPGRGRATISTRPQAPYFLILSLLVSKDLLVNLCTSFLKGLVLLKYLKTGLIPNKIKGTGIILPKKARTVE